ncbi:MAG TPA: cupin domain-containing protein [Noviherbaspirillum sp.]
METGNLYVQIPSFLPEEAVEVLARGKGMRIERIVSKGHCSAPGFWYDQSDDEWVVLLKGEAVLRFEQGDRAVRMMPGDYVNIPAHERHRVESTADNTETVWLAVFY